MPLLPIFTMLWGGRPSQEDDDDSINLRCTGGLLVSIFPQGIDTGPEDHAPAVDNVVHGLRKCRHRLGAPRNGPHHKQLAEKPGHSTSVGCKVNMCEKVLLLDLL